MRLTTIIREKLLSALSLMAQGFAQYIIKFTVMSVKEVGEHIAMVRKDLNVLSF